MTSGGDTDDEWLDDGHLYEALDSHYEPVGAVPEAVDSDDDVVEEEDKELGDEVSRIEGKGKGLGEKFCHLCAGC